jgi:hypothetical protein
MGLVLRFSFAAQVIAAFVIFVLGYIGLFATLMLGLVIIRLFYEGAKWIRARAIATPPIANSFPLSAGYQIERRIPVFSAQLVNVPPRAAIAFHPALNRRRVPEILR